MSKTLKSKIYGTFSEFYDETDKDAKIFRKNQIGKISDKYLDWIGCWHPYMHMEISKGFGGDAKKFHKEIKRILEIVRLEKEKSNDDDESSSEDYFRRNTQQKKSELK